MSTIDDGGPVYPIGSGDERDGKGMSVRAWLAGQAMATYSLDGYIDEGRAMECQNGGEVVWAGAARDCIAFADAVIAELKKGT